MVVYKVWLYADADPAYFPHWQQAASYLSADVARGNAEPGTIYRVEVIEMTREEYQALPNRYFPPNSVHLG